VHCTHSATSIVEKLGTGFDHDFANYLKSLKKRVGLLKLNFSPPDRYTEKEKKIIFYLTNLPSNARLGNH
jgi:hypothetical protein